MQKYLIEIQYIYTKKFKIKKKYMTKPKQNEEEVVELHNQNEVKEIVEEISEEIVEKPKHIPQKPQKFWPMFSKWNQFRWWMWNNYSSKMRVWRWASRGR